MRWLRRGSGRTVGAMRKLILVSAIATLAFAQGKPAAPSTPPAAARDGGVVATRATATADGGVSTPLPPTPNVASGELEKLRRELTELKLRALEAEQRQQARADALNTQMEKMNKQLDDIKDQLTRVSEAEEKRVQADEAAATRRSATASASANLNAVLSALKSGNTADIEPSLRYAEGVFTGIAQKNVQAARAALAQGDVFAARELLIRALMDVEQQR